MLYYLRETTSTNDDARSSSYLHGDVIWAERQSAGRGQRGNVWISGEGLNATFSVVLEPDGLEARRQFLISQITALSLVEMLAEYGICAKIKWTNDIYIGDNKIIGVLIENRLSGSSIARSIIGVGININQLIFDPALPNPTSMLRERGDGEQIPRREVVESFCRSLMKWCEVLQSGEYTKIQEAYRQRMYRLNQTHQFKLADGEPIMGEIEGVCDSGALILRHTDGQTKEYQFKEIEFVIAARGR